MAHIEWIHETDDGEEIVDHIPAHWEICNHCQGEGKSSAYLGAFTREDIDRDWSRDEWQGYLDGAYDRTCETCKGSGKVLTPDMAALKAADPALYSAYSADLKAEADYRQMCRMERLLGC